MQQLQRKWNKKLLRSITDYSKSKLKLHERIPETFPEKTKPPSGIVLKGISCFYWCPGLESNQHILANGRF